MNWKVLMIMVLCLCLMGTSIARADDAAMSDEDSWRSFWVLNPLSWYSNQIMEIAIYWNGGPQLPCCLDIQ